MSYRIFFSVFQVAAFREIVLIKILWKFVFSILATCPAHNKFLDLTTQTILDEFYKSWISSIPNMP